MNGKYFSRVCEIFHLLKVCDHDRNIGSRSKQRITESIVILFFLKDEENEIEIGRNKMIFLNF
jgi:hypothetical protein